MASSGKPVGHQCDQVPEDYFCKQCKHVAQDPQITSYCGECFCKACIETTAEKEKWCTNCGSSETTHRPYTKLQKEAHPQIVPCLKRSEGCDWKGQLQELDAHLQTCGLQKLQCEFSYAGCGAEFIRDHQKEHMEQNTQKHLALVAAATLRLSQEQQKIEQKFQTQVMLFKQTLQEQQLTFDRKLKFHEKIFEQNVQKHTTELAALKRRQNEHFQQLKYSQTELSPVQDTEALEQKVDLQRERLKSLEQQLKQGINRIRIEQDIPPYDITFSPAIGVKPSSHPGDCPPVFITHQGYHLKLSLLLDQDRSLVGLSIHSVPGVNDLVLNFPAWFNITLELLNQHRDKDHIPRMIKYKLTREKLGSRLSVGFSNAFVSYANLNWNAAKQTQYLKNNCLAFRVERIDSYRETVV